MAQFLKDEIKENIKSAAVTVFTEHGFAGASIKAIAAEAQVSVGNVYRYYSNKEALYGAVVENAYNGVRDIIKDVTDNEEYIKMFSDSIWEQDPCDPIYRFMLLYRKENRVFQMLLKNGIDTYYLNSIQKFIDLLRDSFYGFWGDKEMGSGMSIIEASAFATALVHGVIDLLNHVEDSALDRELKAFINRMIKGYMFARQKSVEKADGEDA